MECLSHPDRGRAAQRSVVVAISSSIDRFRWKRGPDGPDRRDVSADGELHGTRRRRRTRTWGPSTVSENTTATSLDTMAPITSVSELTPDSSFGGRDRHDRGRPRRRLRRGCLCDHTRSRATTPARARSTDPGVIYRVDPATGQASVFFDLNSVISQIDPGNATPTTPAANGLLTSTGLVNWYSITFDSEGRLQRHSGDVRQQRRAGPIPTRTSSSRSPPTAR